MALNSITFIFTFLPVLLVVYKLGKPKYKNWIIFGFSIFFYAWGEPLYIFLLLASIIYTFQVSKWISDKTLTKKQKKHFFVQAIIVHVGILAYVKYYGFILDTIKTIFSLDISYRTLPQPLGISFYTFMVLSYIIDVYTKKVKAEKDFEVFGVYVMFFPKLVMGPIERFKDMRKQILHPDQSISLFTTGVERFLCGLAKKVILADSIGILWSEISALPISELSVLSAWIGALAYTLQIYFDFSGYSDMAIGIGNMFGFKLMENFNYPYIATSITDFWRCWHISLSSWFRDYIYIPLGGNRVQKNTHIKNILIVWLLTGLWHGASWNFIVWGLYYGCLLLLEKYVLKEFLDKQKPIIRWLITFTLVIIGWVFFASPDLNSAFAYLKVMFCMSGNALTDLSSYWYLSSNLVLFVICIVCMLPVIRNLMATLKENVKYGEYATLAIYTTIFLLSIAYILSQTYHSFLYTQF